MEEALIERFGYIGHLFKPLTLRSENGLVLMSSHFTACVKDYEMEQEFIEPHRPEQNGIIECFFRSLKEKCVWQHGFERLVEANRAIECYIRYYNLERLHQALEYQTLMGVILKEIKIA